MVHSLRPKWETVKTESHAKLAPVLKDFVQSLPLASPSRADLGPQDPILLPQVIDRMLLLLIDPAG